MAWTNCTVNGVQAATDGTEAGAGAPQGYVLLTDQANPPNFPAQTNFFLASPGQNQMLAIALAAVTTQRSVGVGFVPPNPNNSPYTAVTRLILIA